MGGKGSGPARGGIATLNNLRNGAGLSRRLTVGELPNSMIAIKREGRKYRRELEAEVLALRGEINTTDAHLIDTAAASTVHAGICRWLLRNRIETMTTGDILTCSREITKGKETRDKAVKALALNVAPEPIDLRSYIDVAAHDPAGDLSDK